jgi:hypothetical protein
VAVTSPQKGNSSEGKGGECEGLHAVGKRGGIR